MNKKMICIVSAVLAILFVMSLAANARADSAGNVFLSESGPAAQTVEKDLYWAGSSGSFNGYQIGKSFLAAGRDITVSETAVGGSLRAAGYTLTLNGVDVADNITAAGYELQMSGVTASGVYLTGYNIYFSGSADNASMAGSSVTLDGEVDGDASILADKVVLGENLQVTGTLTVKSGNRPVLPSGAKIGNFIFEETASAGNAEEAAEDVKETKKSSSGFGKFIRGLLGALLLGALICLLLGAEELSKPGAMLLSRPFPMLGTGFAAIFVIPGIILLLLLIGFGAPGAGLLAILFAAACIYAVTFTGVTLAMTLLPRYTDIPALKNEWICSLIGALVFWILRKIPVIGTFLLAASVMYTLGYFIQSVFLRLKGSKPREKKGTLPAVSNTGDDVLESIKNADPAGYGILPEKPAADEAPGSAADDNDPLEAVGETHDPEQ